MLYSLLRCLQFLQYSTKSWKQFHYWIALFSWKHTTGQFYGKPRKIYDIQPQFSLYFQFISCFRWIPHLTNKKGLNGIRYLDRKIFTTYPVDGISGERPICSNIAAFKLIIMASPEERNIVMGRRHRKVSLNKVWGGG